VGVNRPIANNELNAIINANSKGKADKSSIKKTSKPKSTCAMIKPR